MKSFEYVSDSVIACCIILSKNLVAQTLCYAQHSHGLNNISIVYLAPTGFRPGLGQGHLCSSFASGLWHLRS